MITCKHYFYRTVKNRDGIPIDYNKACLIGHNINDCGTHCSFFTDLFEDTNTVTTTTTSATMDYESEV